MAWFLVFLGGALLLLARDVFADEPTVADATKDSTTSAGDYSRNNVSAEVGLPVQWKFDRDDWEVTEKSRIGKEVRAASGIVWTADVHPRAWPPGFSAVPAVTEEFVFVGSDGPVGELDSGLMPASLDAFRAADGKLYWRYISPRRWSKTTPRHDWDSNPIVSTPHVEGDRLWFVSNRCEVICLDVQGFRDDENDGPYRDEPRRTVEDADVVWKFDMIKELDVSPHELSNCSIAAAGDRLFVCTSNGVDNGERVVPRPMAPSFIAMDKTTGKVLWTDNSPGANILDGQWSSPAVGKPGGREQVIFAGGDGWLYSFDPAGGGEGRSKLLWKFDCNLKAAQWYRATEHKACTRGNLIGNPVIAGDRVYSAIGQEGEIDTGTGGLWCLDPTKSRDVSSELVFAADGTGPIAHRRACAVDPTRGETVRPNPNSAAIWRYTGSDINGDGKIDDAETLHGTVCSPVVKDGLVFLATFDGWLHCVDAKTGRGLWVEDLIWHLIGTPLVADGKVYVGTAQGDVFVFACSAQKKLLAKNEMGSSVESTIVARNGRLYIATSGTLVLVEKPERVTVPVR